MSLSTEAIAICGQHYKTHGKGNGCHKCPIRDACISSFALTEQNLQAWQCRVNDAATSAVLS
jgi:uncharacterized protein (UPF0179 family)